MPTEKEREYYAQLLQIIQQIFEPEDIFSEKQLSNWAEAAGWVKP